MTLPSPDARIVLVETSAALPGLLPATVWRSLDGIDVLWTRDAGTHPSTPYLEAAGLRVETLAPLATEARRNLLATGGGDAAAVGLAKALIAQADLGDTAWLADDGDEKFGLVVATEASREGGYEVEFAFLMGAPAGLQVLRLVDVMRRLRGPEGCPWDAEQDHATLRKYLLEEAYELVDAIDDGDDAHIVEELGDVLLQVVFHAQIGDDRRAFGIDDVARGISDKLVRRHPHVFADGTASTADEVQESWDELKAAEKPERTGTFDGVVRSQPALPLMVAMQKAAAKIGFEDKDLLVSADKIEEELAEVLEAAEAGDASEVADEVGDLFGAVVWLARSLGVDPETALRAAGTKFQSRVEAVQSRAERRGLDLLALDGPAWMALYDEVKAAGF